MIKGLEGFIYLEKCLRYVSKLRKDSSFAAGIQQREIESKREGQLSWRSALYVPLHHSIET